MKNNIILITCLSLLALFSSCEKDDNFNTVKPSETITTESIDASEFTELEVANDFIVYINFSETEEKVEIRSNENLHQYITAEQIGDRLTIEVNDINISNGAVLEAFITTKLIDKFNIAADSKVILNDPLAHDEIEINIASDSKFEGELTIDDLDLNMSSDAEVNLSGTADQIHASLAGDCEMNTYDLVSNHLTIEMSGDCKAYVTVNESIEVDATGDSELYYKGDATIDRQNLSGDSKIQNEN